MKKEKDKTFEQSLVRLEEIVKNLEEGVDNLDDILTLYEEGSELIVYCSDKLTNIESRIEIITRKMNKNRSNEDGNE